MKVFQERVHLSLFTFRIVGWAWYINIAIIINFL